MIQRRRRKHERKKAEEGRIAEATKANQPAARKGKVRKRETTQAFPFFIQKNHFTLKRKKRRQTRDNSRKK